VNRRAVPTKKKRTRETVDFYLLSNLFPKNSGLPFVVWIANKGGARHGIRVYASRFPKVGRTRLIAVAIRPKVRVVRGKISAGDFALLRQWIELNRDVLIRHWDGDLCGSGDALAALKPLTPESSSGV
jgi:hypothetical protein